MFFDDPEMQQYFDSLPKDTQNFIAQYGGSLATLDELMQISKQFTDNTHS